KYLDFYLSEKISVSDEEIVKYYNENRSSYKLSHARARIVHYLFDNTDDANSSKRILLYGDLNQKNELTERFFPEKKLVSEGSLISLLDKEIFNSGKRNKIIGPLKSEFGYHVIDLLERFPKDSYMPIIELRHRIRERIGIKKKHTEYDNLIKELKEKYDIEIN
ncbi:peptidyl-prolyl cis-trans isomerase, partial [bacterium]|nr:peptidyl-prolyl cis-trans isomerase [bacterium]